MVEPVHNVAIFITKLWKMLEQEESASIMSWNATGQSFRIQDQVLFITKLLPMYFKHNNMGSFIRQLNLYDFHKIYDSRSTELEYQHKFFQRDKPDLLKCIKRKLPQYKRVIYTKVNKDGLINLTKEIAVMKKKQEDLNKKLIMLQHENVTILGELAAVQAKCTVQSQILKRTMNITIPFIEKYYMSRNTDKNDSSLDSSKKTVGITSNLNVKKLDFINNNILPESNSIDFREFLNAHPENILLHSENHLKTADSFMDLKDLLVNINQPTHEENESLVQNLGPTSDNKTIADDPLHYLGNDFSTLMDANIIDDTLLLKES